VRSLAIRLGIALAAGCSTSPAPEVVAPPVVVVATSPPFVPARVEADPFEARAALLVERARATEPTVTRLLTAFADQLGGTLVNLEHRVKTVASTARKLRLAEGPPDRLVIDDVLRYTMVVADDPPGHHVVAISLALYGLEKAGQAILEVKNYWPAEDNYSGVHAVLRATDGTRWELQFHTPQSLAMQRATRAAYEELRDPATPLIRKRALFDVMTAAWREVPIPTGILEPGALHPNAALEHRPRP
jgi:hypothetical protein